MGILWKFIGNPIESLSKFDRREIVHESCVQLLTLIQRLSTLTPPDDEDKRLTAKLALFPPPNLTAELVTLTLATSS